MSVIGTELKNFRALTKLTLPELAEKLGVSTTTIVNYETGKRLPEIDYLIDFAEISGISLFYLLGLRVQVSSAENATKAIALLEAAEEATGKSSDPTSKKFVSLPLYSIKDVVNLSEGKDTGKIFDEIPQFSTSWMQRELNATPADLYQIHVDNESMVPTLRPGDTILLDKRATKPDSEGIYILKMNGMPLLKRLQLLPGGLVKVVSDNPAYETFNINLSDIDGLNFAVLGRVVWVVWAGRRI